MRGKPFLSITKVFSARNCGVMSFKLPDYQITRLANYPIIQSWLPLPFHSIQSQSSHFGVAFSSCCPSRSRDQPINRSPDFCPALVIPGACDFIERTRCPYFSRQSFRVSRSACDGERGTPGMQIVTMQLQGILTKQK